MAQIVVNKKYDVSAVELTSPAGFSSPQGSMLAVTQTANQVYVPKVVSGEPRLITAEYLGTVKVPYTNGLFNVIPTAPLKLNFKNAIEKWDTADYQLTNPTFTFDNNLSRAIAPKLTIEPSAYLLKVDEIDPINLDIVASYYHEHLYYEATAAGITVRCNWGTYPLSDADFFQVPYNYYASTGTHTIAAKIEKVKPTFEFSEISHDVISSPIEIETNCQCFLNMGEEFEGNDTIIWLGEGTVISTETVPENAPLNTIYVSGFRNGQGKISPQSVACRAWGNRQNTVLYASWNIEPVENPPLFYVSFDGQTYKSYFKKEKSTAWGKNYSFILNVKIKGLVQINKPIFGLSKWELDSETQTFTKVRYGYENDQPTSTFNLLGQNEDAGNYVTTGRLPNLTYFDVTLNQSGANVSEASFNFRPSAMGIDEISIPQIAYAFDPSTASVPVAALNELPYNQFSGNSNTYKLDGVAVSETSKTLMQNTWGRSLVWMTHEPEKMYAVFRDGAGFIEIDLNSLAVNTADYEPYSFKSIGNIFLLVWKNKSSEEFIYKFTFLAIWLESDKINLDYMKLSYNPLVCYAPRLGKRSPLTRIR